MARTNRGAFGNQGILYIFIRNPGDWTDLLDIGLERLVEILTRSVMDERMTLVFD